MLKEQDTMIKQQNLPLLLICVGWLVETLGAAPALVVYQPPRIEAEVGHPVVLSCTVNNTGGQFFSGVFYRGNSELEVDGSVWCLSRDSCNLSLTIESPSLADANVYYCEVNMPSVEEARTVKGSGTQLSLYVQPACIEIQQSSPLVSGRTATLDCKVSGFYPRNASVLWFHRGTPVLPGSVTENITMNDDGTFSLLSQYNFSPTVKDDNAECACQASHPMWTQTNRTSITLNVSYGPVTMNLTFDSEVVTNGPVHVTNGSTLNLTCVADGNPKPGIQWLGGSIKGVHHAESLSIPAVQSL
ncbi:vascular cell adhesion protein 1-like isoform X1 [Anguilla anguilla]|uniref:vascular cell adhesion protein 1-like isoform X1 n=1 Tax=Anguilla anguilla TaxID=7936 RepID=UPI0015A92CBE|nr:vascular cell adhesion protein 1-like isoform X1 [Anguilla anguilla]